MKKVSMHKKKSSHLELKESVLLTPLAKPIVNGLGLLINFVILVKLVSYIQAYGQLYMYSKSLIETKMLGNLIMMIIINISYGYLLARMSYERKIYNHILVTENQNINSTNKEVTD